MSAIHIAHRYNALHVSVQFTPELNSEISLNRFYVRDSLGITWASGSLAGQQSINFSVPSGTPQQTFTAFMRSTYVDRLEFRLGDVAWDTAVKVEIIPPTTGSAVARLTNNLPRPEALYGVGVEDPYDIFVRVGTNDSNGTFGDALLPAGGLSSLDIPIDWSAGASGTVSGEYVFDCRLFDRAPIPFSVSYSAPGGGA